MQPYLCAEIALYAALSSCVEEGRFLKNSYGSVENHLPPMVATVVSYPNFESRFYYFCFDL